MPWWGKSSKEGKRKSKRGCIVHGKLRILSEKKGGRSGSASVIYQQPSPPPQVSCSQSFSERPYVQPVSKEGHPRSTHPFCSVFIGSKRTGCENNCPPSLLSSIAKPGLIVDTADGKYIDMEFMTASVSTYNSRVHDDPKREHFPTNQVTGCEKPRKTATNCSSSLMQKDKSAIPSKKKSRGILGPSNYRSVSKSRKGYIVLNMPPISASFNAPNSAVSNPLVAPTRAIHYEPLITSGIGSGKSHASTSHLSFEHHLTPGLVNISGQTSVGGDVPEPIYKQQSRCIPESSPTISPITGSAGPCSRHKSATVTPLHPFGAASSPEAHVLWSNDRNRQSYKLPLPPVRTSSPFPTLISSSPSRNPQILQRSVEADNLPSPGPRWKKGHLLGSGTFGHVYLAFNNGDMCAMKEVTLLSDDPKSKESAHHLCQEIAVLSHLRHPNIVQYYGSEMVDDNIYIYLEYVCGGSIHKVLQVYGPLLEAALRSFTKQILSGLAYLHAQNTAHRDIKGANILLQPGGCVKLADFGMAKHITGEIGPMSLKGSPYWIAPEVIRNSNADVSVDIWSLGCTLIEMATGKPPWSQFEGVAALFKISYSNELPPIPDSLSEEGKDFIRKCLQRDPLQRPTASQLLEHPFVKSPTSSERHIPSPEPVEAMHLTTNSLNPQIRNPQSLETGAIHQIRASRIDTPIRNAHSPRNTPSPVSSVEYLLPQPQSPRYTSAPKLSPILTPHGASGSSIPTGTDVGVIQFHHRMRQPTSERLSPISISTPRGSPNSTPRASPTPCHHSQSPKHKCDRLSPSINSSLHAASSSSAHLASGNVSCPFHTKSPMKNMHGDRVTLRPKSSSYPGSDTTYQDVEPDIFKQVPQTPLISQVTTPMHSSVTRDQIGRNFLETEQN